MVENTLSAQITDSVGSRLHARPLTLWCRDVLEDRLHACLGISPFNSHFTQERITELARWALREYEAVHFFVPDVPAVHTLVALGYPPDRAAWKARRQGQYVQNKIRRALLAVGVRDADPFILNWAVLSANPRYVDLLARVRAVFESDPDFHASCVDAARWVLDRRLPAGIEPTRAQLLVAVEYLLAEIPLFLDTPHILGVGSSVFCYHQAVPFLEQLYLCTLSVQPDSRQGFAVLADVPPEISY